jgi:hypothetical protein
LKGFVLPAWRSWQIRFQIPWAETTIRSIGSMPRNGPPPQYRDYTLDTGKQPPMMTTYWRCMLSLQKLLSPPDSLLNYGSRALQ